MKIVNRTDFLAMPIGTVFQKFTPCIFGPLCIKGESLIWEHGNDFYYQDFDSVGGSEEHFDTIFDAERNGIDFQFDFYIEGRDGLFDMDQKFCVWSDADVEALITRLQNRARHALNQ